MASIDKDFRSFLEEARALSQGASGADAASAVPPSFLSEASVERRKRPRRNFAAEAYLDIMDLGPDLPAEPAVEDQPVTDPDRIGAELGLDQCAGDRDFDRARREFAKHSHPDLVSERHRDAAMLRMQIANRLIDDAKQAFRAGRTGPG